jgi:hypothetical protein
MSRLSQMWCLFETVGLHGRVATGFRDQCRSRCTGFWRSSSIPTGATAVFRCGRGGRPSYWSPAGRENRSSPAGMADASSGGRYWARNDCSTDGCCSASGRRRWRRARLHCRRGDRWRCSRGCPRDGGRNRGCAGRGWWRRSRGGDRTGRYDSTGGAEWFSGHDRDGRNYDTNRDDSEHADSDWAEPSRPGPALARHHTHRRGVTVTALTARTLDKQI